MELSQEIKDFLLDWCFYNDEFYIEQMKALAKIGERVQGEPFQNFAMLMFPEEVPNNN